MGFWGTIPKKKKIGKKVGGGGGGHGKYFSKTLKWHNVLIL